MFDSTSYLAGSLGGSGHAVKDILNARYGGIDSRAFEVGVPEDYFNETSRASQFFRYSTGAKVDSLISSTLPQNAVNLAISSRPGLSFGEQQSLLQNVYATRPTVDLLA